MNQLGNVLTLLGALGVAQAVLVGLAVLTRRRADSHPAVALLGALLLTGAAALGAILLSHQVGSRMELWSVELACTIFSGPLFYAWVARVLEEERRGALRLHLAGPLALAVYQLAALVARRSAGAAWPQLPLSGALLFQAAYTAAAAVLLARRWRQPEAQERRATVATLIALLVVVHLASLARTLAPDLQPLRDLVPGAAILLLYAVGFLALRQPRLLYLDEAPLRPSPASSAPVGMPERTPEPEQEQGPAAGAPTGDGRDAGRERRRYGSSSLSSEQAAELRARLLVHLGAARPHLRCDLTLPELARELDTLPTHLSRAVNEGGESFPDLLARLRVEEARRLLADTTLDHLTVEALGRRAGFRSRSAFYEAFRRRLGVTPSAYRRRRAAEG